ncbi:MULTISPECIES: RimK/LysX family protein [unclassified Photobacterium]|uniref:putative ATP-dependent zinc protease n=1 Tax=unclassified Photobacterium TaxID=2628852 RepID=UPI001E2C6DB5|nr:MULTISPECIES: RimK/LysX family protein [unclassified Photobacterium]
MMNKVSQVSAFVLLLVSYQSVAGNHVTSSKFPVSFIPDLLSQPSDLSLRHASDTQFNASSDLILAHNSTKSANSSVKKETQDGLFILGRHEWILLASSTQYFSAYIDPLSENSRIGVSDLVEFERNGKDWVTFKLLDKEYKFAIHEKVKVPDKSDKSLPVVKLRTKLGDINEEIEYVLINGGSGIVLGENFLRDLAVQNRKYDYIQGRVKK